MSRQTYQRWVFRNLECELTLCVFIHQLFKQVFICFSPSQLANVLEIDLDLVKVFHHLLQNMNPIVMYFGKRLI